MDFTKLNKMQLTEKYFKNHFKDIYSHIITLPPTKFQEKIYWYIYKLTEYPKCPICGKIPSFININKGYRIYCSRQCLNSDPSKIEKTKQICIKKYGGVAPACSSTIQEKAQQTCNIRYGCSHALQNKQIKNKVIKTNRKKYGVDWVGSSKEIRQKINDTNIERYGGVGFQSVELKEKSTNTRIKLYGDPNYNNVEKAQQTNIERYGGVGNASKVLKEKFLKTRQANIIDSHDFLIGYTNEGEWVCKCPNPSCSKCNHKTYITTPGIQYDRERNKTELCTNLLPIQQSHSTNTTIELYMQNVLEELGMEYETNKFILDGKQIDIWIPSKSIGIELNGIWYHSSKFKSPNYHINKYKLAKNNNIQLISIWEDQIQSNPDIIKSIIATKLGCCNNVLYARKCDIREVSSTEAASFLQNNHIQGKTNCSLRLGLYYKDKLVSLMTFATSMYLQGSKTDKEWKLTRFCNLINTRVIGAASKLLKYFISKYNPSKIVSFSANDISNGGLYEKLGFITDGNINSSYYYIKGFQRWHRTSFTKSKIVSLGWKEKIDNTWTEEEVMNEHGFLKIYDSGTTKWILLL